MRIARLSVLLSLVALTGCATSTGQPSQVTFKIVVPSDTPHQVITLSLLTTDCTVDPNLVPNVTKPEHGVITMEQTIGNSDYVANDPRHHCNEMRTPVTAVIYRSESGYQGFDHFTINIVTPKTLLQIPIAITVNPGIATKT